MTRELWEADTRVGRVLARGRWRAPRLVIDRGDELELATGDPATGKLRALRRYISPADVIRWLPPVDPPMVLAVGRNYAAHCKETGADAPPAQPLVFLKAISAVTGHRQPVRLPARHPDEVDYEAELAVVIGKVCSRAAPEEAMDHVVGFTCANDVSARDVQNRVDGQWARAKSFDTFCPLGPWLVRPERVDMENGRVRSRVNGELRQDAPISDMIFDIARIISFISEGMTLPAGTVILTGTPSGVGAGFDPPKYLKPGDSVTVHIDGVGELTNPVAEG